MSDTDARDAEVVPGNGQSDSRQPARPEDNLPTEILALPLNQRPVFPSMMLPLSVSAGPLADAVRHAIDHRGGWVGFFLTYKPLEEGAAFNPADLHPAGCVVRILKHQVNDSGALQIFCQVHARFRITGIESTAPHILVRGVPLKPTVDANDPQVRACAMSIVSALKELVQHNPVFADEIKMVLANFNNLDGPGRLADLAATLTTASRDDIQDILATEAVLPRMEKVLILLAKESQLAQIKHKITRQIEEKVSDQQRKFVLTEQLKAIKQELGVETDEKSLEISKFRSLLETKKDKLTEELRSVIDDDLRKLSLLEPASPEYGVTRSRLEWLTGLPWGEFTTDNLDLRHLRTGLDKDHHGLDEVKERIVEFCAVRKLKSLQGARGDDRSAGREKSTTAGGAVPNPSEHESGGIICLVGPPGTGKTSIGQSIARHLGRKFFRLSLGGMRDEAEIKGHRRTYVGALPGKLVQALRRSQSMNPVILFDEIDKLSNGHQGNPSAALLEVLDPEQNKDFLDHYLDVRVDLSRVLFVCTANDLSTIPEPLRDRMEIIRLAGYVESEKRAIARNYLLPKQRTDHGLTAKDLVVSVAALAALIRGYAREAGVRHLEQLLGKLCRKVATAKAAALEAGNPTPRVNIGPAELTHYLGKPLMRDDELMARAEPGVVTGLAWTAMGGVTLEIEAVSTISTVGKGGITLTGQLGDVMKESATLARSHLMSIGERFGVPARWFEDHHVHIHVPAGATPKDGPSAGVTIATALVSLATGRSVRRKLGMTGELTLTGRVFPIGGVREKLVAAKRSGLTHALLPAANERDYAELPEYMKEGIEVTFVDHLDQVLTAAGLGQRVVAVKAKVTTRRKGRSSRGAGAARAS